MTRLAWAAGLQRHLETAIGVHDAVMDKALVDRLIYDTNV